MQRHRIITRNDILGKKRNYVSRLHETVYDTTVISFHFQTSSGQWSQGEMKKPSSDIVALIQWIPRLTKTPIPGTMLDQLLGERSGPLSASNSANIDPEDLADMVQWSDLVIFDYLSGNYDRIASMMVSMMIFDIFSLSVCHNLVQN